ncbi:unnamed protein product [Acanthoscelides obtectus]|nr:unnamed protein product [Acanthoscelides obtectus]CAK1643453.1 Major facilitator superfamily domain-containing protein 9 [Acanthoscelides obtectus]
MWLYSTAKVICVANTAVQTLLKTTVTDLCASDEESSKVFNKLGAFNSIAFLFGIVLGSHIADYERGIDYAYLLIISNIVVSIGLVKTLPRVDSKGTKHDDKDVGLIEGALKEVQSVYIDLKKLVVSPRYWDIFTIHLLIECGFFMYYNSSGLTLRTQHNMSEKYIGYLITLIMVVSVGCRLVMSKMKSKFYPTDLGYLMLWHSTLAEALAYLTLALTSSLAVFVLAMAAVSCAKTFIDTALNNLLLSRTEASEKGIVISSFDNVVSVGQVLGPLLAGTVSEIFGIRSSYIVGAVFMFVGSQIANTQRTR